MEPYRPERIIEEVEEEEEEEIIKLYNTNDPELNPFAMDDDETKDEFPSFPAQGVYQRAHFEVDKDKDGFGAAAGANGSAFIPSWLAGAVRTCGTACWSLFCCLSGPRRAPIVVLYRAAQGPSAPTAGFVTERSRLASADTSVML